MKKRFIAMCIVVLGLYSCQQQSGRQKGFTIDGNIQGLKDSTYLYLRYHKGDSTHVDSSLVNGGKFTFEGVVDEPNMAIIYRPAFKGYFQFYLENARIEVNGNADSLEQISITGSATQKEYESYTAKLEPFALAARALHSQYTEAGKNRDEATLKKINEKLDSIRTGRQDAIKTYIRKHPDSYVSIDQLSALVYSTDYKELNALYKGLSKSIQQSASGKRLGKHLEIMAKTAIGQPAPAFTQNDTTGHPVSLSDFKGKYVLVDFWASWCGPCRRENPNVVKAYNKYKDQNFTILGVSLDDTRANWLKAIADDGLVWTQVSDLKGWKNEVAKEYGVRAIPANFLINPEGVIIGHNLRGDKLEHKLDEVLK